jgi:hypothetical protein
MIIGAHSILFSTSPEKDRAFLRDVFQLPHVDAGEGWLIFGLPPSELAVHPGESDSGAGLYLMTANVEEFVDDMTQRGIEITEVQDQGWGLVTEMKLPGGGALKVYQPQHPRPESPSAPKSKAPKSRKKAAKKAAKKTATAAPAAKKSAKTAPVKAGKKAAPKKKAGRRR